ncbi:hypothetical protein Bbelb_310140 [Branchiostoma belcheri]|nr:hypothetical protein Bbelb_310140 [Branchiostoma belcheri]
MFGTAGRSRRQWRLKFTLFLGYGTGLVTRYFAMFRPAASSCSLISARTLPTVSVRLAVTLTDQLLSQLYHTDDFMPASTFGTMVGRGTLIAQELFTRDIASASHFFLTYVRSHGLRLSAQAGNDAPVRRRAASTGRDVLPD